MRTRTNSSTPRDAMPTFHRLAEVKRRYDPANLYRA